jgi:hypothetical protein
LHKWTFLELLQANKPLHRRLPAELFTLPADTIIESLHQAGRLEYQAGHLYAISWLSPAVAAVVEIKVAAVELVAYSHLLPNL